jgi:anion-transporting  ArsA/GET3 family ATPase
MDDGSEFANVYIERMLSELTDMMKYKIMADTKIQILEKMNGDLVSDRSRLLEQLEQSAATIAELQGRLDKRQSKTTKPVDTF